MLPDAATLSSARDVLARAHRSFLMTLDPAGRPCASTIAAHGSARGTVRRLSVDGDAVRIVLDADAAHAAHVARDDRVAVVAVEPGARSAPALVLMGRGVLRPAGEGAGAMVLEVRVESVRATLRQI